jgi:sporulation protein YlmC with PRC-barrel domain
MLHQTKDLQDLTVVATDGTIGDVKDIYFDDEAWSIRYLVVDTGTWLFSRKVLISPNATGKPDWASKLLPVSLTREQVRNSPNIDTDMPVNRQHEVDYHDYFSYPYYWAGGGYPGMFMPGYSGYLPAKRTREETSIVQAQTEAQQRDNDPHLRSCKALVGYHIHATDGEIGQVQSLLVDEDSLSIVYLVVSTSNWWLGHNVLVAPQWIKKVSWAEQSVVVDLPRTVLKQAPIYDSAVPLTLEMEIAIFEHYGRAGYWASEVSTSARVSSNHADA